jgi:hypothetical protein
VVLLSESVVNIFGQIIVVVGDDRAVELQVGRVGVEETGGFGHADEAVVKVIEGDVELVSVGGVGDLVFHFLCTAETY